MSSEQLAERIAKALENVPLTAAEAVAYRTALAVGDPTDVTSMVSVPIYRPDHFPAFTLQGRFSNVSAVVTVNVIRGYNPTGTNTFVFIGHELVVLTAAASGSMSNAGKLLSTEQPFSSWAASGIKVALINSPTAGTVDLWIKRY